jgi:hypothetical protein
MMSANGGRLGRGHAGRCCEHFFFSAALIVFGRAHQRNPGTSRLWGLVPSDRYSFVTRNSRRSRRPSCPPFCF